MEKVSVIMPCFNDGKYINEAVNSVFSQTYQEIELIIVDDGSDEQDTIEILNDLEGKDQITILHSKRLRPAGARNFGISKATGKYILPLDSDDTIAPDYVEKAVKIMQNNANVGIVYCEADLFGEKSGKWDLPKYSFEAFLLDNIIFVTALFYRSDWEQVGGFHTNMEAGMEDYDFWISIIEMGKDVYQIPEILFHYRIKPSSRTTGFQSDYEKMKKTYREIYANHKEFYNAHNDEYCIVLRDALIGQIVLRTKYENIFAKVQKYAEKPVIGSIIRKLINM